MYTLIKTNGALSLLRGNSASCVREFPNAALMFYFYETFKTYSLKYKRPDESDLKYRVMSGATAGIMSNSMTYFLDPVKAVMASDFEGKQGSMFQIMRRIYNKNGLKGFTHGYAATM
jgi:solute carrier family 25 protein 42